MYLYAPGIFADTVNLLNSDTTHFQAISDGCSAGLPELMQAELLFEQGKLGQVEAFAIKAAYRGSLKEQNTVILCANFVLGRLLVARGQPEKALELVGSGAVQVCGGLDSLSAMSIELSKGYLNVCLNRHDDIPQWLHEGKMPVFKGIYQGAPFTRVLHGKGMMLKREWLRLGTYAQEMSSLVGDCSHLFVDLHAKILQAVAAYRLDGLEAGVPFMQEALDLARPDKIILSVAEYGKFVLPLLRHCFTLAPQDAYLRSVIAFAKRYACYAQQQENAQLPGLHPLKDREKLLLVLASEGKSNNEIALHLSISEAAVKKSFSAIYRKLGVRNRVEAVQVYRAPRNT